MRIAICDDEPAQAAYHARILADWARSHAQRIDTSTFDSAEAFLFAYEADADWDLLLLDVEMKAMDGVALARHLRGLGADMPIAFLTAHADFMAEGYEVAALHYLLKPIDEEKLARVLDRASAAQPPKTLLVETEGGQARVALADILCAEAFAHDVSIRCLRGIEYRTRLPIGALWNTLEEREPAAFVRCHRSYIVGLRHVERIERAAVRLDDGATVPLSRRQVDAVNRAFVAFYRGVDR